MHLKQIQWGRGMDLRNLGQGQMKCFCEHGNEPSSSTECWECLN